MKKTEAETRTLLDLFNAGADLNLDHPAVIYDDEGKKTCISYIQVKATSQLVMLSLIKM